jgi:hypothetical protein
VTLADHFLTVFFREVAFRLVAFLRLAGFFDVAIPRGRKTLCHRVRLNGGLNDLILKETLNIK